MLLHCHYSNSLYDDHNMNLKWMKLMCLASRLIASGMSSPPDANVPWQKQTPLLALGTRSHTFLRFFELYVICGIPRSMGIGGSSGWSDSCTPASSHTGMTRLRNAVNVFHSVSAVAMCRVPTWPDTLSKGLASS